MQSGRDFSGLRGLEEGLVTEAIACLRGSRAEPSGDEGEERGDVNKTVRIVLAGSIWREWGRAFWGAAFDLN